MKYKSPHVIAGPPSTAESPDVIAIRSLIDRIVAENGALLYDPTSKQETLLGQSPLREFAAILARKGVDPIVEGRVIVATAENQKKVLDTIQQLGLELQIIFNKGSLMMLPPE
jgi:hydroxymethylpyrimidine pyrophosphatase-like HAD family hydrolase